MSGRLSSNLSWELANPLWAASLNPVLANPILSGKALTATLIDGITTIPHGLGRLMQGWFIIDINESANIYRSQPFNTSTLTLTSSGAVTVNLWVF